MRIDYIEGKRAGNLLLWTSLVLGLATITVLYALELREARREGGAWGGWD